MSLAELYEWASEFQNADDPRLRECARVVLAVLKERAEMMTAEYLTLRAALKETLAENAAYRRELSRLRGLLDQPAPWDMRSGSGTRSPHS